MLLELIRHTIAKCPTHIKKMGYLYESISIEAKYKRYKNSWESHLNNCKSAIIRKIYSMERHHNAIIIGAGSLLDIPIQELSNKFHKVILIDIIKSKPACDAEKYYSNVQFIQSDVTGITEQIYVTHKIPNTIPKINFPMNSSVNDLIISANIASQLPIMPLKFLQKTTSKYEQIQFSSNLIQHHFNSIKNQNCHNLIITDYERLYYDSVNKLIESESALYGIKINHNNSWDWSITPISENKKYYITHKVAVIEL